MLFPVIFPGTQNDCFGSDESRNQVLFIITSIEKGCNIDCSVWKILADEELQLNRKVLFLYT